MATTTDLVLAQQVAHQAQQSTSNVNENSNLGHRSVSLEGKGHHGALLDIILIVVGVALVIKTAPVIAGIGAVVGAGIGILAIATFLAGGTTAVAGLFDLIRRTYDGFALPGGQSCMNRYAV
ncbi:MAG: hypothetical protein K2P51_07800 [Rhabdochlamydiaceae bacterium]|nr:hypothetical protein [Rhabdochlamydiaceae bacterium]